MLRTTFLLLLLHCFISLTTWKMTSAEVTSPTKEVTSPRTKFKAAVYGHAVILPANSTMVVSRAEALEAMNKNLDIYKVQALRAKAQGVDILVFPEDGIYGFRFTRKSIFEYLEYIPDPRTETWTPCDEPDRYPDTDVQHTLSCMAKQNSLYLVANMGDKQPCNVQQDPDCPQDGRYQYNTDVAYGPDGTLLAKYHKYHLFYEAQFNTPKPEIVYFDTPFGRFGMMVCFDILFREPGVPMVLTHNISNIVFPTAWMDALPLLSALGFHSSFPRGLGVNFLSANLHLPERRFHGSGIYTPDGMKAFFYGTSSAEPAELLVAELDVLTQPKPNIDPPTTVPDLLATPQPTCPRPALAEAKNSFIMSLKQNSDEFISDLFYDKFTFRTLDSPSGSLRVCQKDVCCHLQYIIDNNDFGRELFAFGAFDGLHTYEGQYYFQICTLVKCANASDRTTCGASTDTTTTSFRKIEMQGKMLTPFIYPQIILSNGKGELQLAKADSWEFKHSSLWTTQAFNDKYLLAAALYGRFYDRDDCSLQISRQSDESDDDDDFNSVSSLLSFRNLLGFVISNLMSTIVAYL